MQNAMCDEGDARITVAFDKMTHMVDDLVSMDRPPTQKSPQPAPVQPNPPASLRIVPR